MKNSPKPPQASLLLRLLGGGYLVYLAYDLFNSSQGKLVFVGAAAVFALVGGALFVHSLLTLVKSDYFRNDPENQGKSEEE